MDLALMYVVVFGKLLSGLAAWVFAVMACYRAFKRDFDGTIVAAVAAFVLAFVS